MNKAQSETVGLLLLIGISVVSIGVISSYSVPTVLDSTERLSEQETEQGFLNFDSKIDSVVLSSASEGIDMNTGEGTLISNSTGPKINITQEYKGGVWDNRSLYKGEIGRLEYSGGDETIAYEGGGVFKKQPDVNTSTMISEPDIYINSESLRISVQNLTTERSVSDSDSVSLLPTVQTKTVFPNGSYSAPNEEDKTNPLGNGTVYISIESKYFDGWKKFFEQKSQTKVVKLDPTAGRGTVKAEVLTAEKSEVNTAGVSAEKYSPSEDPFGGNVTDGVSYPKADRWIDSVLSYAKANPNVDPVSSCVGSSCGGVYYVEEDYTLNGNVQTNGNATLVIDGKLTVDTLSVSGSPDSLRVVSTEGIKVADGYSVDVTSGSVTRLSFYTKSGQRVAYSGSGTGEGVVYAAGSTVSLNGMSGVDSWEGSIIAEELDASDVAPSAEIQFANELGISGFQKQKEMHIIENRIQIE
jgi:hypothetical protein